MHVHGVDADKTLTSQEQTEARPRGSRPQISCLMSNGASNEYENGLFTTPILHRREMRFQGAASWPRCHALGAGGAGVGKRQADSEPLFPSFLLPPSPCHRLSPLDCNGAPGSGGVWLWQASSSFLSDVPTLLSCSLGQRHKPCAVWQCARRCGIRDAQDRARCTQCRGLCRGVATAPLP